MPLFENPLSRSGERLEAQVVARGRAAEPVGDVQLEEDAERALDVLTDHARGVALGPAVGYNSERLEIEMLFTVEASSVEDLHRQVGHVLSILEKHAGMTYHDSTTSRVDTNEREAVLA